MKSTNPQLELALLQHRFPTAPATSLQNNAMQLAVPGAVINIWLGTGTVQVQGTPTPEVQSVIDLVAHAVGRQP